MVGEIAIVSLSVFISELITPLMFFSWIFRELLVTSTSILSLQF